MGVSKTAGGIWNRKLGGNGGEIHEHGGKRQQGSRERGEQNQYIMNIITYNVRGLGRGVKWAAIRRLVKKENADMICL